MKKLTTPHRSRLTLNAETLRNLTGGRLVAEVDNKTVNTQEVDKCAPTFCNTCDGFCDEFAYKPRPLPR